MQRQRLAQDADTEDEARQSTITVTGSRIQKQDFVANSPITTVDAEAFELTGTINTEDLLNTLPQLVPGFGKSSNNPGDGTATADLRGLGTTRTLVLVDGKRMIPTRQTGVVDLNNIPAAMIERVEVITGGASAVYGSDAVAGVINFIMKDDFEGVEIRTGYEASLEHGDAELYSIDLTAGTNFADGRGNVTTNIGYVNRKSVFQGDRDATTLSNTGNDTFAGGVRTVVPGFGETGSSGVPGGHIFDEESHFLNFDFTALGFEAPGVGITIAGAPVTIVPIGTPVADIDITNGCGVGNGGTNGLGLTDPDGSLNIVDTAENEGEGDGNTDVEISIGGDVFCGGQLLFTGAGQPVPWINGGPGNSRYNYAPSNYLQLPQERFISTTLFNYDITSDATIYGRASASFNQVPQELAPTPAFTTIVTQLDNPFLSADAVTLFTAAGNTSIALFDQDILDAQAALVGETDADIIAGLNADIAAANAGIAGIDTDGDGTPDQTSLFIGRRMVETGSRKSNDDFFSFQYQVGLKGDLTESVGYDVYIQQGRTQRNADLEGDMSASRFVQAANVTDDGTGTAVCVDASNGCAPINVFGPGNVDAAAIAFITAPLNAKTEYNQIVFGAALDGNTEGFLELPGGPIGWAAGVEYREEDSDFRPSDALGRGDLLGFNSAARLQGGFDVYDIFAEFYAPILSDVPFAETLAIEGAYRYSDYSTVGGVEAFKIGGEWAPSDQVRFRALYNTAVRAPNINELFSPQNNGFPTANDPCSASQTPSGTVATLCTATGVPNVGTYQQRNVQVEGLFGGNPNLESEEAETITAGVVFAPAFLEGFTASIDYYNIEITDYITNFGGGVANVLANCYDTAADGVNPTADPNNPFCAAISRAGGGEPIVSVTSQNVASQEIAGIDFQAQYGFELQQVPGSFNVAYVATYLDKWEFLADETADIQDCAGFFGQTFCGDPIPEYKHTMVLNWNKDQLTTNLRWRYIGETQDDGPANTFDVETLDGISYIDLDFAYDLNDTVRLQLGIDNLLDTEFQQLGDNSQQANTYPSTYDVFGRKIFLGAKFTF